MPLASHGSIAESEKRIREMRRASSSGLGDEKPWVKAQASKEKADIAALQQTVEFLSAEAQASREWRAEGRAAIDGLRTDVAGLRSELKFTCGRLERALDELKTSTSQQLASQRGELQVAVNELAALKTQVALLTNGLEVAQASLHEHGGHLKDVAVLKAQHGFLQGAAERHDHAVAEQGRSLQEARAELAGLQQRHAALASGSAAEHAAAQQQAASLRSSLETHALSLEQLVGQVAAMGVTVEGEGVSVEKLKKAAKRHELLLHKLSELHEARSAELRGLVKATVDQLRPLQEKSSRHGAQIEEVSAGMNVLAEVLHFSNGSRASTSRDGGSKRFF